MMVEVRQCGHTHTLCTVLGSVPDTQSLWPHRPAGQLPPRDSSSPCELTCCVLGPGRGCRRPGPSQHTWLLSSNPISRGSPSFGGSQVFASQSP